VVGEGEGKAEGEGRVEGEHGGSEVDEQDGGESAPPPLRLGNTNHVGPSTKHGSLQGGGERTTSGADAAVESDWIASASSAPPSQSAAGAAVSAAEAAVESDCIAPVSSAPPSQSAAEAAVSAAEAAVESDWIAPASSAQPSQSAAEAAVSAAVDYRSQEDFGTPHPPHIHPAEVDPKP
jgi:hypothetical protein